MRTASDPPSEPPQLTQILQSLAEGRPGAADQLLPLVYEELRGLARSRIAQLKSGQTLQATALVHEAWMRLGGNEPVTWQSRAHFFGAAARAMRCILVDQARSKNREKRGGGRARESLPEQIEAPEPVEGVDFAVLDRALSRLEAEHPRPAQVVMLRYFGGLQMAEIAELVQVSLRTAERDWLFARSWLRRVMDQAGAEG